jgi:hypothetical protein
MNNPVSTLPGHELYPLPEGCTGNRLWKLLHARTGASMSQYRDTFERRNLVRGVDYDRTRAKARAHEIMCEVEGTGRVVVLLGKDVLRAFRVIPPLLIHPQVIGGCTWRQLPHPSGRNMWYNDEDNKKLAELLLEELYFQYHNREKVQ